MANGDVVYRNQAQALVNLLDAHTATGADNGVWVEVGNYGSGYIVATGLVGGDALNIDVSNDAAKPANSTHGALFSAAVTSAAPTLQVPVLARFIKAQVTAKAAGAAVTIALIARQ
jgi:hypothetical protein